jgi:hypothetical protein
MQNILIDETPFWTNNAKKGMEIFNDYRFMSILR